MNIPWRACSADEATRLSAALGQPGAGVRAAQLWFYPRALLVEAAPPAGGKIYALVSDAGETAPLAFELEPLEAVNARGWLQLTDGNVVDYAAFWCALSSDATGLHPLLDRIDAPENPTPDQSDFIAQLRQYVPARVISGDAAAGWRIGAMRLSGPYLVKTIFHVSPTGAVRLELEESVLHMGANSPAWSGPFAAMRS